MPFSEEHANRAVRFFEGYLRHTKGQWSGQPFILRDWQRQHIREIFGRLNDDGSRQIRQVYWEIPKKNGKSEIAAGIALTLLYADREPSAEIYGAAGDRDQASIVFNVAASMVRGNRKLASRSKVIDSSKRIVVPRSASFYRALSAEVASKHGFNIHGVVFDELHVQRDRRLWEVLTFGAGDARRQPLVFGITTAGIPGESPVAEELHNYADQIIRGVVPPDPTFYPVIYAAPPGADWTNEEVWRACNPALGDFLNLDSVRAACERAQRLPSEQNSFRRLRLNRWLSQETRFIDMEDWDACSAPIELGAAKDLTWYAGLDLSTKLDVTALVLVAKDGSDTFNVLPFFWLPEENLKKGAHQESAKYKAWAAKGLITMTEGNVVDFAAVRKRLLELRDQAELQIKQVAFDPWNATQLAQQLGEDGFQMVEVRQTYHDLSEPTKELQSCIVQRKLRHGGHPVLRWMADCLTVKTDINGNCRPVKPDRLKSSKRIDGMVALVMGLGRAMLHEDFRSVYSDRGLRFI